MKHTIQYPEWTPSRDFDGAELYTIIWDDEAGTVEGDHPQVQVLRLICEGDGTAIIGRPWGAIELDDVAHNPQHFLSVLNDGFGDVAGIPSTAVLPDILKGIEPLLPEFVPPPPGSYY